jgi:hypothetical protein
MSANNASYEADLVSALNQQVKLITDRVLFEVISVVSVCETYEEFRKMMYGKALDFIKEYEADPAVRKAAIRKAMEEENQ